MNSDMPFNAQQPATDVALDEQAAEETGEAKRNRPATLLAWSIWALFVALTGFSLMLLYANDPSSLPINLLDALIMLAYATVGAVVASRRPENSVGWIFCAIAFSLGFSYFAQHYAVYALVTRPGSLPFGHALIWSAIWMQDIGFLLAFTFLLLLFPNGRLPSHRWRLLAWSAAGVSALSTLLDAFQPGPLSFAPSLRNPLGIEGIPGVYETLGPIPYLLVVIIVAACIASVIVRFRRASADERQQLKWFAYASVPVIIIFTGNPFENLLTPVQQAAYEGLFRVSVVGLPIAAGIAILKYRLYDIDILINRTLVYVPLTAILAGLYAASIATLQKLFIATTGERSDAAIVMTTLILTISFTPIKNGLQAFVDRRFKEAPDATKRLKALREEVESRIYAIDVPQVTQRLLDEAASALKAKSGAIYLSRNGIMELAHTAGEWEEGKSIISVPMESGGRQVGIIRLGERPNGAGYMDADLKALRQVAEVVAAAIRPVGGIE